MVNVDIWEKVWKRDEPFGISRGAQFDVTTLQVQLADEASVVRSGQACGVIYEGQTTERLFFIEKVQRRGRAGCLL